MDLRIIRDLDSFSITEKSIEDGAVVKGAIAIGKFDGIHVGHQALLECIINKKRNNMQAIVFTFSPSPEEFFRGQILPAIDTVDEKREKFEKMGVDVLIEYPLTKESAAISPQDFMQKILLEKLHAGYIVSGKDLSFGNKGLGNSQMLSEFAKENGFQYEMIDKVCIENKEISSTAVRSAILSGDMMLAGKMLGREYQISGEVVHGRALGRTMQMPTINIVPSKHKLLPPSGVYATITVMDDRQIAGVTNIGYKPTVSNEMKIGVETHLFDFDEDVYGKNVIVKILHFIRPEMQFADIDQLAKQIEADCRNAGNYFKKTWF
ncbi:MAG: bifunctional riboflavin kinase/FAD synthetase [Lachnospiraceae bacterium]|nr:bifunctional riboflavin kinase/FAD synthetase [Lachnospiraceae bacterium]